MFSFLMRDLHDVIVGATENGWQSIADAVLPWFWKVILVVILFYAIGIATRNIQAPGRNLIKYAVVVAFVWALIDSWNLFGILIYEPIAYVGPYLGGLAMEAAGFGNIEIHDALDNFVKEGLYAASFVASSGTWSRPLAIFVGLLTLIAVIVVAAGAFAMLVIAFGGLGLNVFFGPLFLLLGLTPISRGMMTNWVQNIIHMGLMALFVYGSLTFLMLIMRGTIERMRIAIDAGDSSSVHLIAFTVAALAFVYLIKQSWEFSRHISSGVGLRVRDFIDDGEKAFKAGLSQADRGGSAAISAGRKSWAARQAARRHAHSGWTRMRSTPERRVGGFPHERQHSLLANRQAGVGAAARIASSRADRLAQVPRRR